MTSVDLLSIVALVGWLVLALTAYRSQRLSGRKTLLHLLLWLTIFLVVAVAFSVIGG